ncbi:MAG: hypothetical protein BAJATHORv1_40264 [Candidatus Thorarchaeota archaeon]|nr:MAG: hypothetical protein BAJATHORv1_40264 [Candidatus Thorarchaeota archaeon]
MYLYSILTLVIHLQREFWKRNTRFLLKQFNFSLKAKFTFKDEEQKLTVNSNVWSIGNSRENAIEYGKRITPSLSSSRSRCSRFTMDIRKRIH